MNPSKRVELLWLKSSDEAGEGRYCAVLDEEWPPAAEEYVGFPSFASTGTVCRSNNPVTSREWEAINSVGIALVAVDF